MVSPQLPDVCPKTAECKRSSPGCPYAGCTVPYLDMEIAKDSNCIRVGCNPNDKGSRRWELKKLE